jgi:hypothetical protein
MRQLCFLRTASPLGRCRRERETQTNETALVICFVDFFLSWRGRLALGRLSQAMARLSRSQATDRAALCIRDTTPPREGVGGTARRTCLLMPLMMIVSFLPITFVHVVVSIVWRHIASSSVSSCLVVCCPILTKSFSLELTDVRAS